MKKKILISSLLVIALTILSSCFVFADLNSTISNISTQLSSIAGTFVIFSAIVTAILYMSSAINPGMKKLAKDALVALIIGVIVLALSSQIQGFITNIIGTNGASGTTNPPASSTGSGTGVGGAN